MRVRFGVRDMGDSYRVHLLGEGHASWCGREVVMTVAVPGRRTICRHCLSAVVRAAEQAHMRIPT